MVFLSTPVPTLRYTDAVAVCIQSGVLMTGTPCYFVDRYQYVRSAALTVVLLITCILGYGDVLLVPLVTKDHSAFIFGVT